MKNKINPEKALKKALKVKPGEKAVIKVEKQVSKATAKGQPLKAAFKNKVADIKYTKAMREMSPKEAGKAISMARKMFKAAKKGM